MTATTTTKAPHVHAPKIPPAALWVAGTVVGLGLALFVTGRVMAARQAAQVAASLADDGGAPVTGWPFPSEG